MSDFFLLFIILCSSLLLFDLKYLFLGLLFLVFVIFTLFKKRKKNKKLIVTAILVFGVGILRQSLTYVQTPAREEYIGIVTKKKDNYFIFSNGIEKFYVSSDDTKIDELDILKIKGKRDTYYFSTLESGFDFNEYLTNLGAKSELVITSYEKIIDFPINFNSYKDKILSFYLDDNVRSLVGGILFNEFDGKTQLGIKAKSLNLLVLFSLTGVYLNFGLYTLAKFLSLKFSKKNSELISLIIFLPFLLFNITKFTTIKVLAFYIFRFINQYSLDNTYEKLDRIGILGSIFLLVNPFLIHQNSFILSFIIMTFNNYSYLFLKHYRRSKKTIMTYVLLFLVMLPFSIKNSNSINLFASLTSYLLIAFFKPIFLILILNFFYLKIPFMSYFLDFIIKGILKIEGGIFSINIPGPNTYIIVIYYVLLIGIFYFLEINYKKPAKKVISLSLVCLLLYIIPINNFMTFEVDYINVGQGDSTLVRYQNTTVLIDTGGLTYSDVATNNLIPFLKKERIYTIDLLFITHNDYDHCGAADSLKSNFRVKNVRSYNDANMTTINELTFKNLNNYKSIWEDENDKSLVLFLKIKDIKFLFMGDATIKIEEKIIKDYPNLKCDYLKVGHHGSNTSSCEEFIRLVSPKVALISCGYNNKYHHPHKATLETLTKYKVEIHRTDLEGTIKYKFWL